MTSIRAGVLAAASVLTVACAGAPRTLAPVPSDIVGSRLSDIRPVMADKSWGTDIEGTDFTAIGAKGSVAVGVLFGALGVAANVAHVNSVNRERAGHIGGLADLDLRQVAAAHLPESTPGARMVVIPSGTLSFLDDSRFEVWCHLKMDARNGAKEGWSATYTYRTGVVHGAPTGTSATDLAPDLDTCFAGAATLAQEHRAGRHQASTPSTQWVRGVDGAAMEMAATWSSDAGPERLVMRLPSGLQEWSPALRVTRESP